MPPSDTLNKLYVEITTACNLDCTMCERRTWAEPFGHMPLATFEDLMEQIGRLPAPPIIHFGGYGEPMVHPHFLKLVALAKATGAKVEMTTNGHLLNRDMAEALIDLDLDRIMVSIDGVRPEIYHNIRVRGSYSQVIENFRHLRRLKLRKGGRHSNPQVGIAFVAMKSNVADIQKLPWLAVYIGAWDIQVSNVVPHYPEMEAEILYERSLTSAAYRASRWVPNMRLPKFDMDEHTQKPVGELFDSIVSLSWFNGSLSQSSNYCRFVHEGYAVIRRDGEVSPCLPLLHDHPVYLHGRRKDVTRHALGNINQKPLDEIWNSPEYKAFRANVREFPFSPCTTCGGCERFSANHVDCSHNTFPTCGGCVWAQGIVQCP
ncbi:MAG: radical SAM protein [Anaerolineae bacterium]|nr:radical SAM protein [Anaerolineae bacterium]